MKTIHRGAQLNAAEIGDLQEAIDALPPEGGSIYLPAGEYEIDATVVCRLLERQHLYFFGDGRGSVIRYTAEDGSPFLDFRGVENSWWPDLKVTMRDLTFVGNHHCGDALSLKWPNDILIDACFFFGFGGTAIRVTPNATNVTVRDCWMRDCHRVLHADNLHHLTFQGNQTRSVNDVGLVQAENVYIGKHCREVRLISNHFAYGHAEAIILDGTAQHVVANNCIEGFPVGITADDCRDITITSNYIHCDRGIDLVGDNRGLIINSNLFTNTGNGAVVIREPGTSGGHVITGNVVRQSVYNDGQRGIDLGSASSCVVADNVFEDLTDGAVVTAEVPDCHQVQGNVNDDCGVRAVRALKMEEKLIFSSSNPFAALHEFFVGQAPDVMRLTLTSWEMNRLFPQLIPECAWQDSSWWSNDPEFPQACAWLSAGWLVAITKRIEGRVVFCRTAQSCSCS